MTDSSPKNHYYYYFSLQYIFVDDNNTGNALAINLVCAWRIIVIVAVQANERLIN